MHRRRDRTEQRDEEKSQNRVNIDEICTLSELLPMEGTENGKNGNLHGNGAPIFRGKTDGFLAKTSVVIVCCNRYNTF